VEPDYIWGDALEEWEQTQPDVRLINLETAITTSGEYWPGKPVHYRMHPANIEVLRAARIDICSLANNHILDWGYAGLNQTLETLRQAGIQTAGAGQDLDQAGKPAIMAIEGKGRVIVFAFGHPSSGIPAEWAATQDTPGLYLLPDLGEGAIEKIREMVSAVKQPGDIVVASIHWGSNWGYEIPSEQVEFAQQLIERSGVDVVHGHSSHHVRPIQLYQGKLILFGAGDLINDYEGLAGFEYYRSDLALLYLARIDPQTGSLLELRMIPMQIRKFRLNRASFADVSWLADILNRQGKQFGTQVELNPDLTLLLRGE
jgi:poly-gamma-glutamate synthesis protein (capsule biosynthesis protein)